MFFLLVTQVATTKATTSSPLKAQRPFAGHQTTLSTLATPTSFHHSTFSASHLSPSSFMSSTNQVLPIGNILLRCFKRPYGATPGGEGIMDFVTTVINKSVKSWLSISKYVWHLRTNLILLFSIQYFIFLWKLLWKNNEGRNDAWCYACFCFLYISVSFQKQ